MTPVLLVELNRGNIHDVEVPEEFVASGPFSVELRNHGEPVHVHVHPDDALSTVARLESDGNLFVEAETTRSVPVGVDAVESPVSGRLEIATGYGAETRHVDVTVEPETDRPAVDVDERLSRPQREESDSTPIGERLAGALPSRGVLPVVALGIVAIAIAGAVATTVSSPAVLVGAGVVVGAVLVALAALIQ
ncbi:MAG: hypothetical protein ABEJ82_09360 [Haloplanus sp.]